MGYIFVARALLLSLEVLRRLLREPLSLPTPTHTNSGCTINFSESDGKSDILDVFISRNLQFKWVIYTYVAGRVQAPLPKETCVINIIHRFADSSMLNYKFINNYLVYSFYTQRMPPYSIHIFLISERKNFSKLCYQVFRPLIAYIYPFRMFYFQTFCRYKRFPAILFLPNPRNSKQYFAIKIETNIFSDQFSAMHRSRNLRRIQIDWIGSLRVSKFKFETCESIVKVIPRYIFVCRSYLKIIYMSEFLNYSTKITQKYAQNSTFLPPYFYTAISEKYPQVDKINRFVYTDDSLGRIYYCKNVTLNKIINFSAFWSPLKLEIWGVALITLGIFSTFQSFFNYRKKSKGSILKYLGRELFNLYAALMGFEEEARNIQKVLLSFAVLILTTLYKEYICSGFILAPPAHIISSLQELVSNGYCLFNLSTWHISYRQPSNQPEWFYSMETNESRRTKVLIYTIQGPPSLISEYTLPYMHQKINGQKFAAYIISTKFVHEIQTLPLLRHTVNSISNSSSQKILCNIVDKTFDRILMMDQYNTPIAFDQARTTKKFMEGGFFQLWNRFRYKNLNKANDMKQKYTENRGFKDDNPPVVEMANLIPLFAVWGALLVCLSFPTFLVEVSSTYHFNLFQHKMLVSFIKFNTYFKLPFGIVSPRLSSYNDVTTKL